MSELQAAIARTRELYAELAELWDEEMPTVAIHRRDHQELHEAGFQATAFDSQGSWQVTLTLGTYPHGARLFAKLEHGCEPCRALWRAAVEAESGRLRMEASA